MTTTKLAIVGCFALVANSGALGQARNPSKTLAAEVQAMHWDAQKAGPLLVLDAAHIRARPELAGLAAFDRKKVQLGDLTAIVPTEMVIIDDSFKQAPNMYDGLPSDAKALYLLRSLSDEQLKKATNRGIGLSDLAGEQKDVFKSLVPHPFKWQTDRIDADGVRSNVVERGTLTDADCDRVRVKFSKRLSFRLYLQDQPRSYTEHSTDEEYGQPGDIAYSRDDSDEFNKGDSYGVKIRQSVDNKPKAAQIDYATHTFDKTIALLPALTIDQLLQRVGSATGSEFHADLRVGDMVVTSIGTQARAGDLLKAIALMVTGTYRRVGDTYFLTSDLNGMGARKLRLAIRDAELRDATWAKEEEWRKLIGKSGAIDGIPFDPSNPLAPNDGARKQLEKSDRAFNLEDFSAQELSPYLRGFLARVNKRYSTQQVNTEQIGVESRVEFAFVLPNGQTLHAERPELGATWSFREQPAFNPQAIPPVKARALPADGDPVALMISAREPAEAMQGIATAYSHGFREIWLETRRLQTLTSALGAAKTVGINVRLVIRPWSVSDEPNPADLDRTILGDTGPRALARLVASAEWAKYLKYDARSEPSLTNFIAPSNPGLTSRWNAFASLAKTPGITGVVLCDTQPEGYEDKRDRSSYGGYTRTLGDQILVGYSVAQRLAFIRTKHLDPIDLSDNQVMANPDTRQPFFLDDGMRGSSSLYDGRDEPHAGMSEALNAWVEYRAKANRTAVGSLLSQLGEVPGTTLIDLRKAIQNIPAMQPHALVRWLPGQPELVSADEPYLRTSIPGSYALLELPKTWPLEPTDRRGLMLSAMIGGQSRPGSPKFGVAVNATSIPLGALDAMLDHYFTRSGG